MGCSPLRPIAAVEHVMGDSEKYGVIRCRREMQPDVRFVVPVVVPIASADSHSELLSADSDLETPL